MLRRISFWIICHFVAVSLLAQSAPSERRPPAGSDESKIAVGDDPRKVTSLLGQPISFSNVSPTRSVCVFKRCTIVFESQKVAELPVMKTDEDFAREAAARRSEAIARLSSRFDTEHARGGSLIYIHKAFPRGKYGTMPAVVVFSSGDMGLVTTYYGGAWIFHDSAIIKVGGKAMLTSKLPPAAPMRQVKGPGGFIEERCVFASASDQEVIRAIAGSSGPVQIMLAADHGSLTSRLTDQQISAFPPIAEMSAAEISAVRECIQLADALGAGSKPDVGRSDPSGR
jgi:hypothetical protein